MVSSVRSNTAALRVPSNSFGTKVTRFAKAKGSVRGEDAPVTALYRTNPTGGHEYELDERNSKPEYVPDEETLDADGLPQSAGMAFADLSGAVALQNVTTEDELDRMRQAKKLYRTDQPAEQAAGKLVGFMVNNKA